jgi:hypothetical protein
MLDSIRAIFPEKVFVGACGQPWKVENLCWDDLLMELSVLVWDLIQTAVSFNLSNYDAIRSKRNIYRLP